MTNTPFQISEDFDFEDFQKLLYEELSNYSAQELANYFEAGSIDRVEVGNLDTRSLEANRMIVRGYLRTKPESFREEFKKCLENSFN